MRERGGTAVKEIARAKNGLTRELAATGTSVVLSLGWRIAVNMGGEHQCRRLSLDSDWPRFVLSAYDAV